MGDVWETVRRYWESPERTSALLHPCLWLRLPSSPLSTPLGAWERHSSSWLPQPSPPSRSLQTQSLCIPLSGLSPVSPSLCLSFVFLSSPPCLPPSLKLSPSPLSLFLFPRREGAGPVGAAPPSARPGASF